MNTASTSMGQGNFRIESDCGLAGAQWGTSNAKTINVHDRALAVVMAAKSLSTECRGEIRVVYAPTGEVIFRKQN